MTKNAHKYKTNTHTHKILPDQMKIWHSFHPKQFKCQDLCYQLTFYKRNCWTIHRSTLCCGIHIILLWRLYFKWFVFFSFFFFVYWKLILGLSIPKSQQIHWHVFHSHQKEQFYIILSWHLLYLDICIQPFFSINNVNISKFSDIYSKMKWK